MPSEVMDQRRLSSLCSPPMTSSFFSDEIRHGAQRKVGFWKPESMHVHHGKEGMPLLFGNKPLSSSPLEKFQSVNIISAESLQPHHTRYIEKQKASMSHEQLVEAERAAGFSMTSWKATEGDFSSRSDLFVQPASLYAKGNKFYSNGVPCENGFFSSSLPDLFNTKFALSSNDALFGQSVNGVNPDIREEASLSSMEEKEIEAQTIGNLLPDDDDLLSGVVDELEYTARPNPGDDLEEDLFYSGGGMELDERVDRKYSKPYDLANGVLNGQQRILNSSFSDEKSYSEYPSRALFVRNVHNNIEDAELRLLFEQYGDIHTLYTDCKNHGFVMLSYYDIRSACNAQKALQNKPLRQKKLDVRFSVSKDNLLEKDVNQGAVIVLHPESSIPNEEILHIISGYGEIKEIHEIPHKSQKLIEFYDVRAAEAALRALNRSDIAGNRFKIEPSLFRDARRGLMQRNSPELERDNACGLRPRENITTGAITCNGLSSGSNRGLPSVSPASIRPFVENTFGGTTSGVSHYLSSPAGSASAGSHLSGFNDLSHSLGNMNLGLESIRNFQPHSLPDYQDGLRNSISYSSPNTMSAMAINIARQAEGVDNRSVTRICTAGLGSQSSEREQAFGASGNGNCPLHGHQFVWTNRNSSHQQLQRPMMWPDSSTFANIPAHSLSQLHGNPRAHSPLLNSAVPLHQHHVGSAPAINPSLWDTCQVYTGDLTDSPNFHPGSIGSMGFPGSSALRSFELSSHNIFHHVRGNYVEPLIASPQIGLPSPQQKYHVFHGRNSMITMPNTIFDAPSDKVRSRRSDANSNQTDNKKQYELDIERIVCGEDGRTTLMIKNIPNKYTSKMLLAAIDEHHRGTYDFIYLPIDFKNKCNVGYAFINMIDPQQIIPFYKAFNGKKWEKFNSEKVASLAYARIQGKTALIAHFQNSSLMNEDKRCRPILFHTDGPNAGDQEPFPMGTNIRSRPGRSRAYNSEDNHQGSPSSSSDCEENPNGIDSSSGSRKD